MREFKGPIPQRISRLPVDKRGFPVPAFVQWIANDKGVPEPHFPVMSAEHLAACVRFDKCWICGGQLGGFKCFVIGPMCVVNRVSAEPPSHYDCAEFAVRNCPFMANPKVGRQLSGDDIIEQGGKVAGIMIERNPGVGCMWTTRSYRLEKADHGVLFRIGAAEKVSFWAHGRPATKAEVMHSVDTGLPLLRDMAAKDDRHNGTKEASTALQRQIETALMLIDGVFEEAA
jgi:hypothetical protein